MIRRLQVQKKSPYKWLKIEIRSPAYPFTPASLDAVKQVCGILTANYVVDTGPMTGLHVHIGRGSHGFEDQHLRI